MQCHNKGEQFVTETGAILTSETQSAIAKEKSLLTVYEELCLNKPARQDKQRSSGKMSAKFSEIFGI